MAQKRKTHAEAFKARVAIEAIKWVQTLSELSATHGVHPTVIAQWKRQWLEGAPEVFRRGPVGAVRREEVVTAPCPRRSAGSRMEVEWLKKALSAPPEARRGWIHAEPRPVSIAQQCLLAGLARSTSYYEPTPERDENLRLMRLIDRLYPQRPFYGAPRRPMGFRPWAMRSIKAGRALDNVFVERLWRSVKYKEIYLRDYADGTEAWQGLHRYVAFYNTERRHQSLGRRTTAEMHFG